MNRKKFIILIVSIAVIAGLTYLAFNLKKDSGKSISELIEFSVEDTSSVDKIIITDALGQKMEVIRDGQNWTDDKGGCITQTNVHFILEALKNIELKVIYRIIPINNSSILCPHRALRLRSTRMVNG